jgi:hypothetical protein
MCVAASDERDLPSLPQQIVNSRECMLGRRVSVVDNFHRACRVGVRSKSGFALAPDT